MKTFSYYLQVCSRGLRDTSRGLTAFRIPLIVVAILGLLIHQLWVTIFPESKLTLGDVNSHLWPLVIYSVTPTAVLAMVILAVNLLMAPARIHRELIAEHETQFKDAAQAKATSDERIARLQTLQQQIKDHLASAPLGANFTVEKTIAWIQGTEQMLRWAVESHMPSFSAGYQTTEADLIHAMAQLRGFAANLRIEHLRR